jgi:ABC-type multidrug transport system fused ATPase/permease subunit
MNGMAASDKIFRLLDLPEPEHGAAAVPADCTIRCREVRFSYEADREILHGIDLQLPRGSFTAIVGESGCGKSTLSALLMGRSRGYTGSITIGGVELRELSEESLMKNFTYVSHRSYLFKGTVRENLQMGKPDAGDAELWAALERANLADFLRGENGLDTPLAESAANLSGGQRQRLALARALLHDSPVYIFDEATSNIDVESENDIMAQIFDLARTKTVLLISHRLANVVGADCIYALESGNVAEHGTHDELLARNGLYARLWEAQQALENGKENA